MGHARERQALSRPLTPRPRQPGAGLRHAAGGFGDPFPIRRHLVASREQLEVGFGAGSAASIDGLEPGVWSRPIQSAYGLHLVWVQERIPERLPTLGEVRSQVVHHFLRTQRTEHLRRRLQELRERYQIRVEDA
jgi:hypothetical protein